VPLPLALVVMPGVRLVVGVGVVPGIMLGLGLMLLVVFGLEFMGAVLGLFVGVVEIVIVLVLMR